MLITSGVRIFADYPPHHPLVAFAKATENTEKKLP